MLPYQRFNPELHEKESEIFRMHLEKTGTMDALTAWVQNIVEIPPEKRPNDVQQFLTDRWNKWNGNMLTTAVKNALQQTSDKLAEVLLENEALKERIDEYERIILRRHLNSLSKSVSTWKEKVASRNVKSENMRLSEVSTTSHALVHPMRLSEVLSTASGLSHPMRPSEVPSTASGLPYPITNGVSMNGRVPLTTVPVATVPVATVPVATVPVATVPVATVPVASVPVATVPAADAAYLMNGYPNSFPGFII